MAVATHSMLRYFPTGKDLKRTWRHLRHDQLT